MGLVHTLVKRTGKATSLWIRAPVVVVRKTRFKSELVHTRDVTEVHVILQKPDPEPLFPLCPDAGVLEGGSKPIGGLLGFPKMQGVKASPEGRDVDYGMRYYYVKTTRGPKGFMHGFGPTWSWGMPSDNDVSRSVQYEEVAYAGGITIN